LPWLIVLGLLLAGMVVSLGRKWGQRLFFFEKELRVN
jgi:hypothetical protein